MKALNLETQLHLPAKIQQLGAKVNRDTVYDFLGIVDEKKWHPKYTREQSVLVARTLSQGVIAECAGVVLPNGSEWGLSWNCRPMFRCGFEIHETAHWGEYFALTMDDFRPHIDVTGAGRKKQTKDVALLKRAGFTVNTIDFEGL